MPFNSLYKSLLTKCPEFPNDAIVSSLHASAHTVPWALPATALPAGWPHGEELPSSVEASCLPGAIPCPCPASSSFPLCPQALPWRVLGSSCKGGAGFLALATRGQWSADESPGGQPPKAAPGWALFSLCPYSTYVLGLAAPVSWSTAPSAGVLASCTAPSLLYTQGCPSCFP